MSNENVKKNGGKSKTFTVFVLGFVLGIGSFWLWDNISLIPVENEDVKTGEEVKKEGAETSNRIPLESENTSQSNKLVIPDQEAGGSVSIQYVLFTEPGWVVIHELLPDGSLGNALGAQRFDVGGYTGTVSLLRVTEVGVNYSAVLYRDNGDKRFDLDLDVPARDKINNIIQARFNIVK